MLFILFGIIAVVGFFVAILSGSDLGDIGMASFVGGLVGMIVAGAMGVAVLSDGPHNEWTHNISNVQAYNNPNGGTVVTFYDGTTHKNEGMDEGGDAVTVNIENTATPTLVKKCQSSPSWLVPWDNTYCYYEITTQSVNSTP